MIKTLRNLLKQDKERFVVPRGVQDVIPIKAIFDDGIFQVGRDKFSKTYKFSDINYAVASREDKEAMFLEYSELLNSFDSGATTKITINNRRLNRADFHHFVVGVGGTEGQFFRHQALGFEPSPYELFCRHSVVFNEAESRKGCGSQNTHPRYGFRADIGFE